MATDIDLASFPIAVGEEPSHLHFESLRRRIWALWHLSAGHGYPQPIDYTEANTAAKSIDERGDTILWADYVDTFNWGGGDVQAGDIIVIYLPDAGDGDIFVNWKEMTEAQMDDYPPTDGDGVLDDTWWKRYPDPNKYHHFDRNADRYFVSRIARGPEGGDREHVLVERSWRWLPRHTDALKQLPPVQYTDTERIEERYGNKVEVNRKHITQTFSLGAKYDAQTTSENHGGPRLEPIYGEEQIGNQYTNDPGEPGDTNADSEQDILPAFTVDEENTTTDKHWAFEAKICAAYQNAIEWLVSKGDWVLEVDSDYSDNYEAYHNATAIHTSLGNWEDSPTTYDSPDIVLGSDGRYYQAQFPSEGKDPIDFSGMGNFWADIHIAWDPEHNSNQYTYARITDKFWGCNEGAIELLLKKVDSFDWYYDKAHSWVWNDLIKARFEEAIPQGAGNEDTEYTLSDGTWRRTWKQGMGRLSTKMRAYEEGEPDGEEWIQITPGAWYSWPGIYRETDPNPEVITGSYSTAQEYENNLISRHDPIQINYDEDKAYPQHEITAAMINEMHAVLSLLEYRYANGLTFVTRRQITLSNICAEDHDSAQAAVDAHKAEAISISTDYDSWDLVVSSTVIGMFWAIKWFVENGKYRLGSTTRISRTRIAIQIEDGLSQGLYLATTLFWRLHYRDLYKGDVSSDYAWTLDIGIEDEEIITINVFEGGFANAGNPELYKYVSLNMPDEYTGVSEWSELLQLDSFPDDITHDHTDYHTELYNRNGYVFHTGFSTGDVVINIDWNKIPDSVWEATYPIETLIAIAEDPE